MQPLADLREAQMHRPQNRTRPASPARRGQRARRPYPDARRVEPRVARGRLAPAGRAEVRSFAAGYSAFARGAPLAPRSCRRARCSHACELEQCLHRNVPRRVREERSRGRAECARTCTPDRRRPSCGATRTTKFVRVDLAEQIAGRGGPGLDHLHVMARELAPPPTMPSRSIARIARSANATAAQRRTPAARPASTRIGTDHLHAVHVAAEQVGQHPRRPSATDRGLLVGLRPRRRPSPAPPADFHHTVATGRSEGPRSIAGERACRRGSPRSPSSFSIAAAERSAAAASPSNA